MMMSTKANQRHGKSDEEREEAKEVYDIKYKIYPFLEGSFGSIPQGSLGHSEGHIPEFLNQGQGSWSSYTPALIIS